MPNRPQNQPALLDRLKAKQAAISNRIKDLEARRQNQLRKEDTRRKIIAGALALEHRDKNPNDPFSQKLDRLLDEYVTRPHERKLFHLAPLPDSSADPAASSAANDPGHNSSPADSSVLRDQFPR